MDLRRLSQPSGPLPSSVYWLRRGAVALGVVGVVVIVVAVALLASRGSGGSTPAAVNAPPPTTASSPPPTVASSPSPTTASTPTTSAAAVPVCAAKAVTVTVTASQRTYASGANPVFAVQVAAPRSCQAGAVALVVTSGKIRIWGSTDCHAVGSLTAPGSTQIGWDRSRSAAGCAAVGGTKTAQAGTYHVTATVDGVTSEDAVFSLG